MLLVQLKDVKEADIYLGGIEMINIGTEVICESENGKQLMVCACTNIDEKGGVCEFYSNESGEWELMAVSSVTEDEFIGYMK